MKLWTIKIHGIPIAIFLTLEYYISHAFSFRYFEERYLFVIYVFS